MLSINHRFPKGGGNGLSPIAQKRNAKQSDPGHLGNLFTSFAVSLMKKIWGNPLTWGRVSRQSPRVRGGSLPNENILSRHFEKKYMHDLDLKLTKHVRNTIMKFRYLELSSEKKNQFWSKFRWKSTFSVRAWFITSLWRHTFTDFHDFGIKGKKRPYPIVWY